MYRYLFIILFLILSVACRPTPLDQHLEDIPKENLLEILLQGNERFSQDHPLHPDQTLDRLRDLSFGQHPVAAIVSCSDSRVPPELILDQGLGDLFVIRNAGNIVADYEIGSVEYAIEHLEVPLVIILGHTKCGAFGAFVEHEHEHSHRFLNTYRRSLILSIRRKKSKSCREALMTFIKKPLRQMSCMACMN